MAEDGEDQESAAGPEGPERNAGCDKIRCNVIVYISSISIDYSVPIMYVPSIYTQEFALTRGLSFRHPFRDIRCRVKSTNEGPTFASLSPDRHYILRCLPQL